MLPRLSLNKESAPEYYTSPKYRFVGTIYDMWLIRGNCTHYAYARSCELADKDVAYDLMNFFPDAGEWLNYSKWKTGPVPKRGAIGVAENHVFIVEDVYADGSYLVSQSSYRDYIFKTDRKNTKVGEVLYPISGRLLGFIYNPYVREESSRTETENKEITTEEAIEKMAKDVISGEYGNGRLNRMVNLYEVIQNKVNEIMKGD